MRRRVCIYIVSAIVFFGVALVNHSSASRINDQITGFIEMVSSEGIQRITFPSGQIKLILKNEPYEIKSFDLSSNARDRILWGDKLGDFKHGIILSRGNELKVIFDKDFVRLPSFSPKNEEFAYLFDKYNPASKAWFVSWHLHLANLDGSSNRKLSDLQLSSYRPAWFPDGKRIAVTTLDLSIYIVDVENGSEKKIIDFGAAPAVSPDGKQIAYLSKDIDDTTKQKIRDLKNITTEAHVKAERENGPKLQEIRTLENMLGRYHIYLYDIETGETKKLTHKEKIMDQGVLWSPDGKYLAYNDEGLMSHEIYIVEVATGQQEKLTSIQGELMVWRKN